MVNLDEKDICRMYLSHMEDSVRPMSCLECSYSVALEEKRKWYLYFAADDNFKFCCFLKNNK